MASRSRPVKALVEEVATRSLDRARAWRFVLATRLMGVRPMDDQASDTLRDVFDALIMLRCEINAIHGSLTSAGVLDPQDVVRRIGEAAEEINSVYETLFPGLWVDEDGTIRFDERTEPTPRPQKAPN